MDDGKNICKKFYIGVQFYVLLFYKNNNNNKIRSTRLSAGHCRIPADTYTTVIRAEKDSDSENGHEKETERAEP